MKCDNSNCTNIDSTVEQGFTIKCSLCEKFLHFDCQLESKWSISYNSGIVTLAYCEQCETIASSNEENDIQSSLRLIVKKIDQQTSKIERVESKIETSISSLTKRVEEIEKLTMDLQNDFFDLKESQSSYTISDVVNDISLINTCTLNALEELKERQIRAKNLILYKLPESGESDLSSALEVLNCIHKLNQNDIVKCSRIGRSNNNNSIRPLCITLSS